MEENKQEKFMRAALGCALEAERLREVPVGAAVVKDGEIIALCGNRRETELDPTAHAEVLALRCASEKLKRWNLSDCDLYVTLEPCVMCCGAIIYSRIARVYFGAYDKRFGCAGSVMDLLSDQRFNHRPQVTGGILEEECLRPIKEFFKKLRLGL